MRRKLVILGSTGSIGRQTLSVVEKWPEKFSIKGLAAGANLDLLEEQARKFKPSIISLEDKRRAQILKERLGDTEIKVLSGEEGLLEVALYNDADWIVNALVGFRGLKPTVLALKEGKNIALANKESLVAGGELVMALAEEKELEIVPIDSEHSAVFQCLQGEKDNEIYRILLTASGGPFRGWKRDELSRVSVEQALKHPNWTMGRKITIDSATLMNKGLEVLEAKILFGQSLSKIEVVIHPQSIIHSMVEFMDGAVLAQLGVPDMGVPIQYALTYPRRWEGNFERLNWKNIKSLTFEEPDTEVFSCLRLAYEAGEAGGTMPVVLNAANEIAVDLFLTGRISFLEIPRIIEKCMHKHKLILNPSLEEIMDTDSEIRERLYGGFA